MGLVGLVGWLGAEGACSWQAALQAKLLGYCCAAGGPQLRERCWAVCQHGVAQQRCPARHAAGLTPRLLCSPPKPQQAQPTQGEEGEEEEAESSGAGIDAEAIKAKKAALAKKKAAAKSASAAAAVKAAEAAKARAKAAKGKDKSHYNQMPTR